MKPTSDSATTLQLNVNKRASIRCGGRKRERHYLDWQRLRCDHTKQHYGASNRLRYGPVGHAVSSERFKKDITSVDKASEAILSLRPVAFHYQSDTKSTPQFGLIAEEVAKVNPALVLPE